jgi:hypothetical protein
MPIAVTRKAKITDKLSDKISKRSAISDLKITLP